MVWPSGKYLLEITLYTVRCIKGNPFELWPEQTLSSAPARGLIATIYQARIVRALHNQSWLCGGQDSLTQAKDWPVPQEPAIIDQYRAASHCTVKQNACKNVHMV